MKIDTHQHFWKLDRGDYGWLTPDLAPLYRDFLPEDLEPLLKASGISATIVVQAADSEAESEYLLSLTDRFDWIIGVVGWVDLEAQTAVSSIERLAQHPRLVGLRPMIQDLADDAWMLRDALRPAITAMVAHNLTFDALVMPRHLGHLKTFLTRYPDLRVVIDHCAKPEIRNDAFEPWATQMTELADFPNVFCKLSGVVTEAREDWTPDDLKPYLAHVCRQFGCCRVLFGSDWPVVNLASSYEQWHEVFQSFNQIDGGQDRLSPDVAQRAYPRISLSLL
ncbi:amidohydrolase family protein [Aliiroseovarius sp. Z3]|uniref:amidohydrolase family protein n=1 Tax=Aliiroseovarius sp. Z3 TaxID=2811402 RepID=UPI0023B2D67B|nr:amidohydrolase family protein [Aliiroseovarius sp. Z3]MDE9449963.1 amidohydrolase family protein [Aliiroseovarius sp. Z3]